MSEIETVAARDLPPPPHVLDMAAKLLALLGGLVITMVACLVVTSVLGRWLFATPVPGDFELVQIGTAISVFAFLPYCHVVNGNILVDTFTAHLPAGVRGRIDAMWDFVYAAAMALIAVSLARGTIDTYASQEVSMVLRLPVWPGIAFGSLCCGFLTILSLWTALRNVRGGRA